MEIREEKLDVKGITATTIYEGGALTPINADHLKDNIIAIRQLINNHNLVVRENDEKDKIISSLQSQIEYLRTTPFISIFAAIVNISASILLAIGVNLLTDDNPDKTTGGWLVGLGAVLIFVGSLSTILYPYVRGWFNKKKES